MQISVILFLIAAWRRAFWRLVITGLVGLLCFAVECYIHFSDFQRLNLRHHPKAQPYVAFQRYFVADFTGITIAISVLLAVVSSLSTAIPVVYTRYNQEQPRPSRDENGRQDPAALQAISATARTYDDSESYRSNAYRSRANERQMRHMTYMITIFLPISFILSASPAAMLGFNLAVLDSDILGTWLRTTFFPRTSFSISDLDQAVAVGAGATILAFNLYSVMKAHYDILSTKDNSSLETTGTELHRRGDIGHH